MYDKDFRGGGGGSEDVSVAEGGKEISMKGFGEKF